MLENPKAYIPKQKTLNGLHGMVTKVEKSCKMEYG